MVLNVLRKIFLGLAVFFALLASLLFGGRYYANSYFIPKVILPHLEQAVDQALENKAKLSLGRLHFNQFRGFMVDDISLTLNGQQRPYLRAAQIDIDLDWLSLLNRQVAINKIQIVSFEANLTRQRNGQFDLAKLIELRPLGKKQDKNLEFEIKEISLINGSLSVTDLAANHPPFKKRAYPVTISITNPRALIYKVNLSAALHGAGRESLKGNLTYNQKTKSAKGAIKYSTPALAQYLNQYLPKRFAPWSASAAIVEGQAGFTYAPNKFNFDLIGQVKSGLVHYADLEFQGDARLDLSRLDGENHGSIELADFAIKANSYKLCDRGSAAAHLSDEAIILDNLTVYNGRLPLSLSGRYNFKPSQLELFGQLVGSIPFTLQAKGNNLSTEIPSTKFFGGTITGQLQLTKKRFGLELILNDCDLATLGKVDPRLEKLNGSLSGNLACTGGWQDITAVQGGGYLLLKNADLRPSPIFTIVEQGVAQLSPGFKMPNFKTIKSNYQIANHKVTLENASCVAEKLHLSIEGGVNFDGETDISAGIKFSSNSWLKTVRWVVLPETIGFDVVANALSVNISGTWPDLKQKTIIQPMRWLNQSFADEKSIDPKKYSLEKLWPASSDT